MKPLLAIPFTIYVWLSIGYCSTAFCQNVLSSNVNKECSEKKNQYLDYSKFVLNSLNSDEFNINKNEKTIEYLQSNGWDINLDNRGLDSFIQSTIKLTGSDLEINVENWKLENDIPQFLIGSIQKNITNTLGLYEWRVKFDDFFALAASTSIFKEESFYYQPIDYRGNSPNQLSIDSWHYFATDQLKTQNYLTAQCEDTIQNILVRRELADNIIAESRKVYQGKQKYYEYSCKKCNCRQSINFEKPIYEEYHTLSLVLTVEHAAFFIDGVLIYVNTLGGNDATSICPLREAECAQNSILSFASAVVQNGSTEDFALRNDMWNYLLTGNEVKWTIDYFRKYDFKDSLSSKEYLKSYQVVEVRNKNNKYKLSKQSFQINWITDTSLIAVSPKKEFMLMDTKGNQKLIIDKKTNRSISVEGDFVVLPSKEIFFVNALGYIEMLKRDSVGNFYRKELLSYNPIQQVKNTKYKDVVLLENSGEIEIIFRTKKNSIGRYFQNRGRWYFIEMTSKSSFKVEGDILTGTDGKIFYRGNDGYLHGIQVKGKKRQSFHINVRPLGSRTPKVSKAVGAFVVTPRDEIIYVNTDNQLIFLHLVKRRYKIRELTKKSKLKCEQAAGRLVWMGTDEINQLLFIDKTNRLCGLKYDDNNSSWSNDHIGLATKTFTKSKNLIVYNNSMIFHLNSKKQLLVYQLTPSTVKVNDEKYAFYIDNANECQNVVLKKNNQLNISNRQLSDF